MYGGYTYIGVVPCRGLADFSAVRPGSPSALVVSDMGFTLQMP